MDGELPAQLHLLTKILTALDTNHWRMDPRWSSK